MARPVYDDGRPHSRVRTNELTGLPASTAPDLSGSVFSDPYSALFEDVARSRMRTLAQPFSDPALDDVVNLIRGQVGKLTSSGPANFGAGNPYLGEYAGVVRNRIAELNQEPFSPQEESRLKTGALESIERDRNSSLQRAKENVARRGMAESSGILLDMEGDINRGADATRATSEREFANYVTGERNRRRDQAVGFGQTLATLGEAEAGRSLQAQIAAHSANQGRDAQIMSAANMLAEIAAQRRGETRANQNDILQIAMQLSQLTPQRLALAMNVLNGTGGNDVSGLFNNTLNLSNTQTANRTNADSATAAFLEGLAKTLSYYGQRPTR
jgi:hypothetical protein